MKDLYQCVLCGWLTTKLNALTPTASGLVCENCAKATPQGAADHGR